MIWSTPQSVFDKLNAEFGFTLDVCATSANRKCAFYFSPQANGLEKNWRGGICWMNPPYGREISAWMKKAWESSLLGATVVCLIPNRSNAPWWHDYVMRAHEIRFVRKKVPFVGRKRGVPFFGSCIVVFRPGGNGNAPKVSSWEQPRRMTDRGLGTQQDVAMEHDFGKYKENTRTRKGAHPNDGAGQAQRSFMPRMRAANVAEGHQEIA